MFTKNFLYDDEDLYLSDEKSVAYFFFFLGLCVYSILVMLNICHPYTSDDLAQRFEKERLEYVQAVLDSMSVNMPEQKPVEKPVEEPQTVSKKNVPSSLKAVPNMPLSQASPIKPPTYTWSNDRSHVTVTYYDGTKITVAKEVLPYLMK